MIRKLIAIVTVLAILTGPVVFANSSTTTTKADNPVATAKQEGEAAGKTAGQLEGDYHGVSDANAGKKLDYKAVMPKDVDIIEKYQLNNDTTTYRAYFLSAYRIEFRKAYTTSFRKTNIENLTKNNGVEHGLSMGSSAGAADAITDYNMKLTNDWERAFKKYVAAESIASRFNIVREKKDYRENFVSAFKRGFKDSYTQAYRERNIMFEKDNQANKVIGMVEGETVRSWPLYGSSEGGISTSENIVLTMNFPAGAIYEPTTINVSGIQHSFDRNNSRYVPVSPEFKISLWNKSGRLNFRKPFTISFNYFGSEKIGIYQWNNNTWEYLLTEVKEGKVSTIIPAGKYNGGRYALFIDESYRPNPDSTLSWARDEIKTFARRYYIASGVNIDPDGPMTRLELAGILYRMKYRQYGSYYPAMFNERSAMGQEKRHVDFCLHHRILGTDMAGNFHPNATVTYTHLSYLYRTLGNVGLFNWDVAAKQMLLRKFHKSPGLQNRDQNASRAEIIFYLHDYLMD